MLLQAIRLAAGAVKLAAGAAKPAAASALGVADAAGMVDLPSSPVRRQELPGRAGSRRLPELDLPCSATRCRDVCSRTVPGSSRIVDVSLRNRGVRSTRPRRR